MSDEKQRLARGMMLSQRENGRVIMHLDFVDTARHFGLIKDDGEPNWDAIYDAVYGGFADPHAEPKAIKNHE